MRLFVHVEGQSEETFVNEVLGPHLLAHGVLDVRAKIVGNARLRQNRGGIKPWQDVRREIVRHLKSDAGCTSTTMVDYYALPQGEHGAWPGRIAANALPFAAKGAVVEQGMLAEISADLELAPDRCRFIPFVLMHEYEALLFSDCNAFAFAIGKDDLATQFQTIRNMFETPEHINDSPITAPSKRIIALCPGYQKPLSGAVAALEMGIARIRGECPRFDAWVSQLEGLCSEACTA